VGLERDKFARPVKGNKIKAVMRGLDYEHGAKTERRGGDGKSGGLRRDISVERDSKNCVCIKL